MNQGSLPDRRPDIAASQHLPYRLALPHKRQELRVVIDDEAQQCQSGPGKAGPARIPATWRVRY
jgi:hypothetical protein